MFQANTRPVKFTNYEGLAYLGEYHLAWAACLGNEGIYNLLLEHGANPDAQDSFGNSVLHMVVVSNNMVWVSTVDNNSNNLKQELLPFSSRACSATPSATLSSPPALPSRTTLS